MVVIRSVITEDGMSKSRLVARMVVALFVLASGAAQAAEIFRDDFSGSTLDRTRWSVGTWTKGRTQFGKSPAISGGIATLKFDTYNAVNPGALFTGSSITVKTPFSLGSGAELEARVRTNAMPAGLITSFFTYGGHDTSLSDEIDFEYLTSAQSKPATANQLSLTSWNDWDSLYPDPNNPARRSTANVIPAGFNVSNFNVFTIRWLKDRVQWLVNGTVVRTSTNAVPNDPMSLSLNFWAPDVSWTSAYSSALQPAATAVAGSTYSYDVDYVVVRTVPEPAAVAAWAVSALLLGRRRRSP